MSTGMLIVGYWFMLGAYTVVVLLYHFYFSVIVKGSCLSVTVYVKEKNMAEPHKFPLSPPFKSLIKVCNRVYFFIYCLYFGGTESTVRLIK